MRELVLHPDSPSGPASGIAAFIRPTEEGVKVSFAIRGNLAQIVVPHEQAPERADDLWRTTCCEVFWQEEGAPNYTEFNLSPSSRWAAYAFTDYRAGREDIAVRGIEITTEAEGDVLRLEAQIEAELHFPAQVGMSVVVEREGGEMQYWALAFPDGEPDFHSAECRALGLAGRL
ncbi:hypothetical protein [Qipengyuania atrilutea]|uniref:DOMON-like domain-containing protein n=1 Tax=Qipengyuania atrilutea TaxID=2744473 RepID=A0A850H1H0_9SPHN|nr:hypothetical protein [Actirhodobacter atriluteus]NVD43778.1 hypothetical protein [Actirhodobacter atriluteus]